MERKDHIIMISIFIITALISLVSIYNNNPTGNVILDDKELTIVNCVEENGWRVCDVQYPDGSIKEKAIKEKIS